METVIKITKITINILVGIVGIVAIVLLVGSFGVIPQFKTYVVSSGSMEPALRTGSIVLVGKVPSYNSEDIISFRNSEAKDDVVTHRIVSRIYSNDLLSPPTYYTKGDANSDIDQGKVQEEQIVGKVFFSLPFLGYFTEFVKKPYGFILFVVMPATIIVYEELKTLKKELMAQILKIKRKSQEEREILDKTGINKLFFVFPILAAAIAISSFSISFFSDNEQSQENTMVAGAWVTPTESPVPTITPSPTPSYLADHVVISEVQTKGNGSNNFFVELYNPTLFDINISSWSFQYRGPNATGYDKKNFESGNLIKAHGFFLVGHNGSSLSPSPDMDGSLSLTLSGGTVFLVNNQVTLNDSSDSGLTVIDKVAYGSGSYLRPEGSAFSIAPLENQSLERKANSSSDTTSMMSGSDVTKGNAYDSENNSNDFILRTTSQPQNTSSSTETP